jgi:hypothetical protein
VLTSQEEAGADDVVHHVLAPDEVGSAIYGTLPPGPGHRHRCIFELARRLRAMPQYADATAADLLPLLERWHRLSLPVIATKCYAVSRRDFLDGWHRVRYPAGRGAVDRLWKQAGTHHDGPLRAPTERVARLCRLLQERCPGKCFFLACRTVGRLAGVSHVTAWKWLRLLEGAGVLKRTLTGTLQSKKANEYRFVADTNTPRGT